MLSAKAIAPEGSSILNRGSFCCLEKPARLNRKGKAATHAKRRIPSCDGREGLKRSRNSKQLDLEVQGRVGRDDVSCPSRAVAQLRRNDELALAPHFHACYALVPAFDDLPGTELERKGSAPHAGVERPAVFEGSGVVDGHVFSGDRFVARTHDGVLDLKVWHRGDYGCSEERQRVQSPSATMLSRTLVLKVSGWKPVERLIRSRAFRPFVRRFVPGETIEEAIAEAERLAGQGYFISLDYLGENTKTETEARAAAEIYARMVEAIAASPCSVGRKSPVRETVPPGAGPANGSSDDIEMTNISIKLTQL